MPPGAPWRCRGRRDGRTVRAVSCMRGRRSRAARARPSSRGVHALPRVFLFRPSPKVGVNPDNSESDSQLVEKKVWNHGKTPSLSDETGGLYLIRGPVELSAA